MKRNSTRHHRSQRQNVLELRVVTPRIVWFGFLRYTGGVVKFALILAALGGLGWAAMRGIRPAFYQNPDFRLAVIDLNQNPVIDELGFAEIAGVDLTRSPSLFDIDLTRTEKILNSMPAITRARIERKMPDTLIVRVTPRVPCAWISQEGTLPPPRQVNGILVDREGIAYPCPPRQYADATALPVIEARADADFPITPGKPVTHPSFRHGRALLDAACAADPEASRWIDSVRQSTEWSLTLTTRDRIEATFSLGDHARQMDQLRAALDHASNKGLAIATINLIPKYNVPVTLRGDSPPPRAIPVSVEEPAPASPTARRSRDLNSILNRP